MDTHHVFDTANVEEIPRCGSKGGTINLFKFDMDARKDDWTADVHGLCTF